MSLPPPRPSHLQAKESKANQAEQFGDSRRRESRRCFRPGQAGGRSLSCLFSIPLSQRHSPPCEAMTVSPRRGADPPRLPADSHSLGFIFPKGREASSEGGEYIPSRKGSDCLWCSQPKPRRDQGFQDSEWGLGRARQAPALRVVDVSGIGRTTQFIRVAGKRERVGSVSPDSPQAPEERSTHLTLYRAGLEGQERRGQGLGDTASMRSSAAYWPPSTGRSGEIPGSSHRP